MTGNCGESGKPHVCDPQIWEDSSGCGWWTESNGPMHYFFCPTWGLGFREQTGKEGKTEEEMKDGSKEGKKEARGRKDGRKEGKDEAGRRDDTEVGDEDICLWALDSVQYWDLWGYLSTKFQVGVHEVFFFF